MAPVSGKLIGYRARQVDELLTDERITASARQAEFVGVEEACTWPESAR